MGATSRTYRRREFLRNAIGLGLAGASSAVLSSCGGPTPSRGPTNALVYAGFGGSYEQAIRKAIFNPFAKRAGIDVSVTAGAGNVASTIFMVQGGRTSWDLVDAQGATLGQFRAENILQRLDDHIVVEARERVVDPSLITPYSVPWYQFSHNIFWNTSVIDGPLRTWADVWDVKRFPGKRGFQRVPWFTLEIALAADGVPIHDLYPLDLDRAFNSLDRIRPHSVFLDNNSLTNAVASQEVLVADLNLLRVQAIQRTGVPLTYTWNQAMLEVQQLVVLKGAPNRYNAMNAVEYSLRPERQLAVLDLLGYTPTVRSAVEEINPKDAKDLPGTPQTVQNSFYLSSNWWAKHGAEASRMFQDWLAS